MPPNRPIAASRDTLKCTAASQYALCSKQVWRARVQICQRAVAEWNVSRQISVVPSSKSRTDKQWG